MASGFLITFEGGEGSGKTTQIDHLVSYLEDAGHTVVRTREPGGSPGAEAIRHLILSGAAETLGAGGEAMLFAAARADHVATVIAPALEAGAIVVCDRFIDSTRVYQGEEAGDEAVLRLEGATLGNVYPDLTLIFDVPAELGAERARARRGEAEADRFEREDIERQDARRAAFLEIADAEPDRCVVIDAGADIETVAQTVIAVVDERLDDRRFEAARQAIGEAGPR